jgi:hypothetical protein
MLGGERCLDERGLNGPTYFLGPTYYARQSMTTLLQWGGGSVGDGPCNDGGPATAVQRRLLNLRLRGGFVRGWWTASLAPWLFSTLHEHVQNLSF